jgi:hypothetical protein
MGRQNIPLTFMISTANTTTHRYNPTKIFSIHKLNLEFKKLMHIIFEYKNNIFTSKFLSKNRKNKRRRVSWDILKPFPVWG